MSIKNNIKAHSDSEAQNLPDLPPLQGQVSELANAVDMYLAGKSVHTQRMTRSHMNRVARLFGYSSYLKAPWGSIRYIHVEKVLEYLQSQKYAPQTINATIAAIRGTALASFKMNHLNGEALEGIKGIKMVRGSRLPAGRMIPVGEIKHLINACCDDETASGPRDMAIIGFLYIAGLTRSEVVNLQREDLDLDEGTVKIMGRGSRQRQVFLDQGTMVALKEWFRFRTEEQGPLFVRVRKGGQLVFTRLSEQAIYEIVRKRWREAGIPALSPKDFRKTFISSLLRKGIDLLTVQWMAGHSSPQTTSGYDPRPQDDVRKASKLLHLPYRGSQGASLREK